MLTASEHANTNASGSRRAREATKHYAIAIIDDCFDDYALLEYLLGRSNILLTQLTHYSSVADLWNAQPTAHDIVFMDERAMRCDSSEEHLQEICARQDACSVFLQTHSMETPANARETKQGSIAVVQRGALSAQSLETIAAAAALVGPRVGLQEVVPLR